MPTERLNASGWYEYSNGTKSGLKTGSSMQCTCSYSFYTNNSQYYPTSYKGIQLYFGINNSAYKTNHYISNTYGPYVYVISSSNNFSGRLPDTSRPVEHQADVRARDFNSLSFWPGGYESVWTGYQETSASNLYTYEDLYIAVYGGVSGKLYIDNYYSGTFYLNLAGNTSSNAPYLEINWTRCDPTISNFSPSNGAFVNDKEAITIDFTVKTYTSESGITYNPTEITFMWGTDSSTPNIINIDTSARSVTIPANTFPVSGTVYWKFRWKSDAVDEYIYSSTNTYSTIDSIPVVKPASPVNASINGEIDQEFTWTYEIDTGSPQTAFDLQISNNDGSSWEDIFSHYETSETKATIPADTFLAGTGLWKVRGYNSDNVASAWSDVASIIVRAASLPPVINSVTTIPRVTVTWQASGQQAFRLTAKSATESYESGIVFGTGKTFTIPHYWDDGELQIAISIENRFGVWSDEATTAVIIQNTPSGNISLNGYVEGYGAVLSWRTDATFKAYYVLRDGIAIACVTDTSYVDRNICGDAVYRVMGVTENGNYTESETLNLYSAPEHAVVGLVDGDDWVELRVNRGGMPEITETHMEDISYQYYSGRMYPVAYSSMFRERTKTFGFTVWKEASEKLQTMIGHLVVLKDYTGGKIIGVLNNLQLSGYVRRPDVSFDITVIDYSEEVSFDV